MSVHRIHCPGESSTDFCVPAVSSGHMREHPSMTTVRRLGSAALDLLLAQPCAGCGAARGEGTICHRCRQSLEPRPMPVLPRHPPQGFPPTVAAMDYEHVVRRLLVTHKEHAALTLARPLGLLLAAAVAAGLDDPARPVVLVPIPSLPRTTRSRGHNPVKRMASAAVSALAGEASVDAVLRHRRRVDDQSHLSVQQRRANLDRAFVAARPIRASPDVLVVLVDDICSSGATLTAGAQALRGSGVPAASLLAAVVASTPLRLR